MRRKISAAQWDADYLWMEVNVSTIDFVLNLRAQKGISESIRISSKRSRHSKYVTERKLPFGIASLCSAGACSLYTMPYTP